MTLSRDIQGDDTAKGLTRWGAALRLAVIVALSVISACLALSAKAVAVGVELGGGGQPWSPGEIAALNQALIWDLAFIAGYGSALWLSTGLARSLFWTPSAKRVARVAQGLAVATAGFDLLKVVFLLGASHGWGPLSREVYLTGAAAAAITKFSCAAVAGAVAVVGVLVTAGRLATNTSRRLDRRPAVEIRPSPPLEYDEPPHSQGQAPPIKPAPGDAGARRWRDGFQVPELSDELALGRGIPAPATGFCVSGGGIRSATVTLGALQALRSELQAARYLVAVSGGGYLAGALQLAMQPPVRDEATDQEKDAGAKLRAPSRVLMPGSLEEDRLRRHSNYIADTAGQWLVALGVLLRGLAASLLLLAVSVVIIGVVIGRAYRAVPITDLSGVTVTLAGAAHVQFPTIRLGAVIALAVIMAFAALGYLALVATADSASRLHSFLRTAAAACAGLGLLVATLTLALPTVIWASALLLSGRQSLAVGGSIGTVGLTYASTLASMLWRKRAVIGKQVSGLLSGRSSLPVRAVPNGILQRLLMAAALILVAAGLLLLLGGVAAAASKDAVVVAASLAVLLAFFSVMVDETWLSLHPFYRRRLAAAFAVRPVAGPGQQVVARAYDPDERTTLSTYARRVAGFPEVVFMAAAHLSGQERTPPGLRTASFVLTSSWVGGPDVGYVKTADLQDAVSSQLRRDLTVEAAMAVSGAAFASAMGRSARWHQTLYALTNARLGTWLPNPYFLQRWAQGKSADNWRVPGLPRVRRLPYLLREILGLFSCRDRLVLLTDGGHYENLGLVELLRRRCTEIYCVDASGDPPPSAGLAEAIALAREELGVDITLHDSWSLVPGSGEPLDPKDPLASLNQRLSRQAVITGEIRYPQESGLPDGARAGRIVIATALLTRDMPHDLLSYAARNPVFPRDGTADQWFNDEQFIAYQNLGRMIGERAKAEMRRHWTCG